jgi:hypothetical protein
MQAHGIELLGHRGVRAYVIRAAVKLVEIRGDEQALGVIPGTLPDPAARIHGWPPRSGRRTQIGAPRVIPRTLGFRECGAMRVGAGKTTKVAALARTCAGHEERHHRLRAAHGQRLGYLS